jgi:transposase-like protein
MKGRRQLGPEFKAKVALAALKGDKTIGELSSHFEVHSTQINHWKKRVLSGVTDLFRHKPAEADRNQASLVEDLYKQIGKLQMETEWLKKKATLFGN